MDQGSASNYRLALSGLVSTGELSGDAAALIDKILDLAEQAPELESFTEAVHEIEGEATATLSDVVGALGGGLTSGIFGAVVGGLAASSITVITFAKAKTLVASVVVWSLAGYAVADWSWHRYEKQFGD